MKLGKRHYGSEERHRTAIGSMVNGTIGGHSKIGMPIVEVTRVPLVPTTGLAEGTFTEGLGPNGRRTGGTVDISYGGITLADILFDPVDGIRFPAGLTLTDGTVDYSLRLAAGSDVTGGGAIWVHLIEEGTNIGLAQGPDHFLSGTTPGTTIFSGSIDLAGPYTFTSNHWLEVVFSFPGGPVGIDQSHWETTVQL